MISKDFDKEFGGSPGRRCMCGNKIQAFSIFKGKPVLTCTNCGTTKEYGNNKPVETFDYTLTKQYKNEYFWQHVWV